MRKVIISGGGTGGHIFPALSIAGALKRLDPEIEILFVGAEGKMEMQKVPEAGFPIIGLPVMGLKRRLTLGNIRVILNLLKSLRKARRIVREFRPDAVVGVGGYASGPIGRVAARAGIPLILQEQNSYAGITNRLLAKKAGCICVAYDGMERFFEKEKLVFTGNPVRKELLEMEGKREEGMKLYGLDPEKKTILVTGGSLGAGSLNGAVRKKLDLIASWKNTQLLWQCGGSYYESLQKEVGGSLPANVRLEAFLKRMDLAYACADVVVARAGAGTISELCLLKKAAVLVPSPNVAEDHQTKNALALVEKGAALMIRDAEVSERLADILKELTEQDGKREELTANIASLAIHDSDLRIAEEILKRIDGKAK
ncbi:MAG: undecaprenyldiphospho-muramoylpentapeptide beta-N-acetylglucosaminyltransferase [Culturomica sp.]|jgi:UDP-N-acetylglucosamine--N-acetylmuramyl-(pentapeptide) pyrophosphoryl-undecaprenol N-acetylglucosamine transferase|nr:undecaprenyldiphospho-muramoylpentapeptide beta-N-acetylglucosaminyltransferase [Culturomica sp.]